jgi:hypothetical protein
MAGVIAMSTPVWTATHFVASPTTSTPAIISLIWSWWV